MSTNTTKSTAEAHDQKNRGIPTDTRFNRRLINTLETAPDKIPEQGYEPREVKSFIEKNNILDFRPQLNTSSYVNVALEEEEEDVALLGLKVNIADQTVYPQSYKMQSNLVDMIANLWNCPQPDEDESKGYAGACTVGSTEACLLAGLALKFRWRKWYADRKGLDANAVLNERPNIIISTCYQAAWEKLIKYMDIECKLIPPSSETFTLIPEQVGELIDDHTIGVVCIMGNHYAGQYDPVWAVNDIVEKVNKKQGLQVGIHVDAASGGFIAPFQPSLPAWDFRLKNVLSISSSGHKFGASCCGTGWIVWRRRKALSEYVATSVTYLGGQADSYTLNFSRPASGLYVQYYKFLHYGLSGYQQCCDHMMRHADIIRKSLEKMRYKGKKRFIFLDNGSRHCLPVVAAMLNPMCDFKYNDIDLQAALAQRLWYVSAYKMGFEHPLTGELLPLFTDQDASKTMFRIVVKNNISLTMVEHLLHSFERSLALLDTIGLNLKEGVKTSVLRNNDQILTNHC